MPNTPLPPALAGRCFSRDEAMAAGLSLKALRGPAVRRIFRGVYADPTVPDTFELRCAAAQLALPPTGALARSTAAWMLGLPVPARLVVCLDPAAEEPVYLPGPLMRDRIQAAVPYGHWCHDRDGIDVSECRLPASDVIRTPAGLRVVRPARTLVDLSTDWSLGDLVAFGDAALRAELEPGRAFTRALTAHRRRRGIVRARQAVALFDGRAESPRESMLRVRLWSIGLPRPEVNVDVCDELGRFVARPDLSWAVWKVAVEYDGRVHASAKARSYDEERRHRLREAGWLVRVVTADDLNAPYFPAGEHVRRLLRERGAAV